MRKNISIAAAAVLLALGATAAFAQPAPDAAANRLEQSGIRAPHGGAWAYYANETWGGFSGDAAQPAIHENR